MELEEMKILWGEMSKDIEKQKTLTDKLILKMIRINYRNKLNKILIPEAIGSFVCLCMSFSILIYFQTLNTWYLQISGIICALILLLLPVLSITAIRGIRNINISATNYKDTLSAYSKAKLRFVRAQKLSLCLSAVLMLTIMPVVVKIMNGKDVFMRSRLWICYALALPIFYLISRRVFKCYVRTTVDAENILKELDA